MEKIEESKEQNNDSSSTEKEIPSLSTEDSKSSKKGRKPFEWTEKRLEAFKKMREGLDTKNEIAKELKAEKKKSEKDEIKKRIREIMSSKNSAAKVKSSASDSEDSNNDVPVTKKVSKKAIAVEVEHKSKKSKPKRAIVEVKDDSSEEEEESQDSEGSEEKIVMTKKQYEAMQKSKKSEGKAPRSALLYKPSDQFILL